MKYYITYNGEGTTQKFYYFFRIKRASDLVQVPIESFGLKNFFVSITFKKSFF